MSELVSEPFSSGEHASREGFPTPRFPTLPQEFKWRTLIRTTHAFISIIKKDGGETVVERQVLYPVDVSQESFTSRMLLTGQSMHDELMHLIKLAAWTDKLR